MSYPGPMHPQALAIADFHAKTSTDLTVKKGDHVFLIWTFNDGWFVCNSSDAFGCVPAQFLESAGYGQLQAGAPPIKFPEIEDEGEGETSSNAETQSSYRRHHSKSNDDNKDEKNVNEAKTSS
ncbi:hypothetical protein F5Y05DRAFT_407610 [Hypoxylon sp. FL0543]|nr:hypothetical protein F5Y05DRAFT_407610 [Hypoxylon sp. FL0543]